MFASTHTPQHLHSPECAGGTLVKIPRCSTSCRRRHRPASTSLQLVMIGGAAEGEALAAAARSTGSLFAGSMRHPPQKKPPPGTSNAASQSASSHRAPKQPNWNCRPTIRDSASALVAAASDSCGAGASGGSGRELASDVLLPASLMRCATLLAAWPLPPPLILLLPVATPVGTAPALAAAGGALKSAPCASLAPELPEGWLAI